MKSDQPSTPVGAFIRLPTHPYLKLLEAGWLLVALITPLWINLWGNQPFDYGKAALMRTIVWLMAAIWLAGYVDGIRPAWPTGWIRVHGPLFAVLSILAITWIISTVISVDPATSLHGSYERGQGLLTRLSYALLMLIVACELRSHDQVQRLVTAIALPTLPMFVIGILQWVGYDPFGLLTDARSPVYATLGRANFVSAYAALALPLILALARAHTGPARRFAWIALAIAQMGLLLLAQSRAGWLSAGLALLLLLILEQAAHNRSAQRRLKFAVAALLLGAAALITLALPLLAQEGSLAARGAIWRTSITLVGEHPWLGYGFDTLDGPFLRAYPPQLVYYQGRDAIVDRSHNWVLDTLLSTGLLGLLTGALLAALIVRAGYRCLVAETGTRAIVVAAVAALVGHGVGLLASFDVTATYVATALLAGAVLAHGRPGPNLHEITTPPALARNRTAAIAAALLTSALVLPAIVAYNFTPVIADAHHRQSVRYAARQDFRSALAHAHQAADLWPIPAHWRLLGARALDAAAVGIMPPDVALADAEAALMAPLAARTHHPADWITLGHFYRIAGSHFLPNMLDQAHIAYSHAQTLAPNLATIHVARAEVYFAQGNPTAAALHARAALNLDATQGDAYRQMGDALLRLGGSEEDILDAYRQAVRWSPNSWRAAMAYAEALDHFGHANAAAVIRAAAPPHPSAVHHSPLAPHEFNPVVQ